MPHLSLEGLLDVASSMSMGTNIASSSLNKRRLFSLVVELGIGLAEINPHVTSVRGAPFGVGVVGVLVAVEAHLVGLASDLDASSLAGSVSGWADLDVGVPEGRANQTVAATIEIAEIPVQAPVLALHNVVFKLQDSDSALPRELEARALAVCDPVEADDLLRVDDPGLGAVADAAAVGSVVAAAVVRDDDGDFLVAPVVEVESGVGAEGKSCHSGGADGVVKHVEGVVVSLPEEL